MRFIGHLLLSIFLLPLYLWIGNYVIIAMISSVLIDIDHISILIKEKTFSHKRIKHLSKMIHKIYMEDPENAFKDIYYPFHTLEFNILIIALSFWSPLLKYISIGFLFHIFIDIIHHKINHIPIKRWLLLSEFIKVNKIKR